MRMILNVLAFAACAAVAQDWYPSQHGAGVTLGAINNLLPEKVVPAEDPDLVFPVHPELLAKNGIYILENMDVRALAADQGWEFLFVLGQPRFEGPFKR